MKNKTQFQIEAQRLTNFYSSFLELVNAPDEYIMELLNDTDMLVQHMLSKTKSGNTKPKNFDEKMDDMLHQAAMLKAVVNYRKQAQQNSLN